MAKQDPIQAPADDWRGMFDRAFELVELGKDYADDGAYFTAASRLEAAAQLFREGVAARTAFIDGIAPLAPAVAL